MAKMLPAFVENCFECPFFQGTTYLGGRCGRLAAEQKLLSAITGYGIPGECPLRDSDTPAPRIPG